MIDAHAHLTDDAFQKDLADVLRKAREAGLEGVINPGIDIASSEAAIALAERMPDFVFPAAGIHPHDTQSAGDGALPRLRELLSAPAVIGVGETGLDFFKNYSPREIQIKMFVSHIELAMETGKPIIAHVRDAYPETYEILKGYGGLRGMIHSFSDGPEYAEKFVDLGFHVSFSGMLTYPKAAAIREAAKVTPLDRILLETDAPYLPPQSRRGKRCEPADVLETAAQLAEVKGLTLEPVNRAATENARQLFRLPVRVA